MSILKNEPIYAFKDDDYMKPRHIIVAGTNEEIGFDLATLAKQEYGCKLGTYDEPIYAKARKAYLAKNWPHMLERSKGVLRAYGLPEDDVVYDATSLPFDWYDVGKGSSLDLVTCSAALLPHEKTDTGTTYISRNFDMMAMVLWSDMMGKQAPEGAHNCFSRAVVLETRPEKGYKTILVGGHELLSPYLDGLNEKGLYITQFHDPGSVGKEGTPPSGMDISGVSTNQLLGLLLDTCATVEETKQQILQNRIMQVAMRTHLLIADAGGNAAVFEIDQQSVAYVFVDRQANEPLFVTNHPLHIYPTPDTYPDINMDAEHNSFTRQLLFRDKFAALQAPYKREDATTLTDAVHCAFVDDKQAEAGPKERTLMNVNADLSKPELRLRWYLGDAEPIPGTNHLKDRMSDFYTFGF
jgi:hypothetical protein